jgi:hypothetical protein
MLLKSISVDSYADEETPIAKSVAQNNFAPILASLPIAAFGKENASAVVDVTDFFAGDTPALSGLSTTQRRTFGVQRFDTARSFVSDIRSFPTNVEVRHVQTFAATDGPGDRSGGTVSLEMRQSIVLLPKEPMKPRTFDPASASSHRSCQLQPRSAEGVTGTFIAALAAEPKDPPPRVVAVDQSSRSSTTSTRRRAAVAPLRAKASSSGRRCSEAAEARPIIAEDPPSRVT